MNVDRPTLPATRRPGRPAPQRAGLRRALVAGMAFAGLVLNASYAWGATALADGPVLTGTRVPGNLALALSVEFPTAVSVAHLDGTLPSVSPSVLSAATGGWPTWLSVRPVPTALH